MGFTGENGAEMGGTQAFCFIATSLTGLKSLLRDLAQSSEPASTHLQRWPCFSHLPGSPLQDLSAFRPVRLRTKLRHKLYWESPCKPHQRAAIDPFRRVRREQASSHFKLVLTKPLPCSHWTQTLGSDWLSTAFYEIENIWCCVMLACASSAHPLAGKQRWGRRCLQRGSLHLTEHELQAPVERAATEKLVGSSWQRFPAIGFICIFQASCSIGFDVLFIQKNLSNSSDLLVRTEDWIPVMCSKSLISRCAFGNPYLSVNLWVTWWRMMVVGMIMMILCVCLPLKEALHSHVCTDHQERLTHGCGGHCPGFWWSTKNITGVLSLRNSCLSAAKRVAQICSSIQPFIHS